MSKERLMRAISKQTDITKLQTLKATGLDKLIQRGDIDLADKLEFETIIDARIVALTEGGE